PARAERARIRALIGDRAGAEADLREAGSVGYSVIVRTVMWWNDRELAAQLADAFESAKSGAPWEAAAPILRALARGELFPHANEVFKKLVAGASVAAHSRCRVLEVAAEYLALMGQHDTAFEWLEQAEELPFTSVLWMDRCPCLAPI